MNRRMKLPLILLLCLTLTLLGALPAAAAIDARKHQPPSVSSIDTIYAIDQGNQTYHPVPKDDWDRIRSGLTLSTTPSQNENKNSKYVGGFCFVLGDGTRRIYTISETQVLVGNIPLFASVTERTALAKLSRQLCEANPAYPAMLAYMDTAKISRATFYGYGATNNKVDTGKHMAVDLTKAANQDSIKGYSRVLKDLEVTPRSTSIGSGHKIPANTDETMEATIEFTTGVQYTISIDRGELVIYSSDGTRTYTYSFPDYDPRRPGYGQEWQLRKDMWEIYRNGGNYNAAAVFLTKTNGDRTRGAFYSIDDGGLATMARLAQILDDIRTATPFSRIQSSDKSYLEVWARSSAGDMEHFELDGDKGMAYYVGDDGKGRSVALNNDDYVWVKSLLNGKERSNRTMLIKSSVYPEEPVLYTCSSRDPLFGQIFDVLPKDPAYSAYTAGSLPTYAKVNKIECWGDPGGLTATTVYSGGVMVQQSNLLPWSPAKYDASTVYTDLAKILQNEGLIMYARK